MVSVQSLSYKFCAICSLTVKNSIVAFCQGSLNYVLEIVSSKVFAPMNVILCIITCCVNMFIGLVPSIRDFIKCYMVIAVRIEWWYSM